jgi:hypothetical protein
VEVLHEGFRQREAVCVVDDDQPTVRGHLEPHLHAGSVGPDQQPGSTLPAEVTGA